MPVWAGLLPTALAGVGQGLFVALLATELARPAPPAFQVAGAALALALAVAGLAASYFQRGWTARASWRHLGAIVLVAFMAAVATWAVAHALALGRTATLAIGAVALALGAVLFPWTGTICPDLSFGRELARPLTTINFALLGTASGFTLGVPLAVLAHPPFAGPLALAAFVPSAVAWLARGGAARARGWLGYPRRDGAVLQRARHPAGHRQRAGNQRGDQAGGAGGPRPGGDFGADDRARAGGRAPRSSAGGRLSDPAPLVRRTPGAEAPVGRGAGVSRPFACAAGFGVGRAGTSGKAGAPDRQGAGARGTVFARLEVRVPNAGPDRIRSLDSGKY